EGVAVADSLGITLDSDPDALIDHAAEVAYDHRASMLQDALAHRRTEIDALNGGIVRFGAQRGVPTPLHEAIVALIGGRERSWRSHPPAESEGAPPHQHPGRHASAIRPARRAQARSLAA